MLEVNLERYSTLGIGGRAEVEVVKTAEALSVLSDSVIIGGGSNVLFGDRNLPPIAINKVSGISVSGRHVYAYSGTRMAELVRRSAGVGLSGLEWAYGLPGSVGGAVVGNAGANGKSVSDNVLYVDAVKNGRIVRLSASQCGFAYRNSALSGCIVSGACFWLERGSKGEINGRIKSALEKRMTQPKGKSAGCTFKNPDGYSAGWLIQECGLKGKRVGGAVISERHANFIINIGSATAKDVYSLILTAEKAVYDKFGIKLDREIKIVGEI